MSVRQLSSLQQVATSCWPPGQDFPFLHPGFLLNLERSGAASEATGWIAAHLQLGTTEHMQAVLPSYLKTHSRGEYVFDQAWAAAYHRHGLRYYPRLVSSIPFTPVQGPRCLRAATAPEEADLARQFLLALPETVTELGASSWHGLFLNTDWQATARQQGLALRAGCQFYWQDQAFGDFDGFLGAITAKRRKTLRRERSKVNEAGVLCQRLAGTQLEPAHWEFFYRCYANTYAQRGQRPYLPLSFFQGLGRDMAEQLMLVLAYRQGQPVASALFLHDRHTLYGRYWGCQEEIDCLHFEVCYYQGIEYCLDHGLTRFDPGTQGEHKIARGFRPELTWSAHWLAEPAFMEAVLRFVSEEEKHLRLYQANALSLLPFKD